MDSAHWLGQRVFEWTQPGPPGDGWRLAAGGEQVGSLKYNHWLHKSAEGETSFGRWKFERTGFWRSRYSITRADTGEEIAAYIPRWSATEGTITFNDGRRYRWEPTRFWSDEHALVDESGSKVLVLTTGSKEFRWSEIFKQQGRIRVESPCPDGTLLSVLLLFAWWMTLVQRKEASAAAVVVMG